MTKVNCPFNDCLMNDDDGCCTAVEIQLDSHGSCQTYEEAGNG